MGKKEEICCIVSPILFIYAKITNLFVVNISEIDASELLRPFLILNVIYFFCFYVLYLLSKRSLIHASLYSVMLIITQFMVNDFEYLVFRFLGEIKIIFRFAIYVILSVIPLFVSQLLEGKPLTITDPSMTRFLMSLEESVSLVLHAFEFGKQG
uniref:polysaccharide biosynthesis protein n=1 Tax=Armatimonas sp. TaxID=1872638 RepID=UPI00286A621D